MIPGQKAQPCVSCPLNICFGSLLHFFTGQFQKLIGKHPVAGSRLIQCISHIKKDYFLIVQKIKHSVLPVLHYSFTESSSATIIRDLFSDIKKKNEQQKKSYLARFV